MGVSWVALMMLGTLAHAQQPKPAAHRPDRVAPTPSAPADPAGAAMSFAPKEQTANGVAQPRPRAPTALDLNVLAAGCANCHGPVGHPTEGIAPLAGLPLEYLRERLSAFKTGKAPEATIMPRLLAGLEAAELEALAQWFAQQPQPTQGQPAPSRGAQ